MPVVSIGDLAQSFQLRRDSARLSAELQRLTETLTSGIRPDISNSVSGDFGALTAIERSLKTAEAYRNAGIEAELLAGAAQAALGVVQSEISGLVPNLLLNQTASQPAQLAATGTDARTRLETIISSINAQAGGRTVFAGAATDGAALAGPDVILDELALLAAAETTAAGVKSVVDAWFAPGGGFETAGYVGSASALGPIPLSENETAEFRVNATDLRLREALKGVALGALLDRNILTGNTTEQTNLAILSSEVLLNADSGLVGLRSDIGVVEGQIERAASRISAEVSALELGRNKLIGADPYETAAALETAQAQLEALYTLTARMSRLSLTEYL